VTRRDAEFRAILAAFCGFAWRIGGVAGGSRTGPRSRSYESAIRALNDVQREMHQAKRALSALSRQVA
jgi:hypothetical protein